MKRAYKDLKVNWKEMQRIKKDRFLRQALIDGDEFFEIQVCTKQTGLSELVFSKSGAKANQVEDDSSEHSSRSKAKRREAKYLTAITNHNSLNVNFVE